MPTLRIPIHGFGMAMDTSSNVFLESFASALKATNGVFPRNVLVYNPSSTRDGSFGGFTVPKNYSGATTDPKIIVVWSTVNTSGDVEWDFDYRAIGGDDSESLDQVGTQETVNQNDTAPSASWEKMEASLTLTRGNFAVDDEVQFGLYRDQTDAGDTLAVAALVWSAHFEYDDV